MKTLQKTFKGQLDTVDACVYRIPENLMQSRKNIVGRFWEGKESLEGKKALVLKYQDNTRQQIWMESTLGKSQYLWYDVSGPNGTEKVYEHTVVPSTHEGGPGVCGAIALLADGTKNDCMIAMHVACDIKKKSMLLLVTRDMLKAALPEIFNLDPPTIVGRFTSEAQGNPESDPLIKDTTIEKVGQTNTKQFVATKTTLMPSIIFDKIVPHTTEPSVLSPHDPRVPENVEVDLFRAGINKMKSRIDVSYDDLEEVRADMICWYGQKKRPGPGWFLTLGEALNPGDTLKSIDMSTSPGFPFTMKGKVRTDLFFRDRDDKLFMKAAFLEQLYVDLLEIKAERLPQWFVIGSLKDERRPIEKVRVNPKTRLFTVCPIVMILLEKVYFGRFMELLLRANNVPYAGGVDRLGISWHYMMMDLMGTSDRGFGGDYECYDGKISQGLILSAIDIMMSVTTQSLRAPFLLPSSEVVNESEALEWCSKINGLQLQHEDIFRAVRQSLANPTYLLNSRVLAMAGTLTSGCWTTQLIGTLTGEMLQRMAWNELAPPHVRGGYFFKLFVANKIMSDDNINAVVESATSFYNATTYAAWLRKKGMIYTSADKSGEATAVEKLEDISFLKNTTSLHSGFFSPVMEWKAAVEPLNWVRRSKTVSPQEAIAMNANCVLRAVFFHGKEKFDDLRAKLAEHLDLSLIHI